MKKEKNSIDEAIEVLLAFKEGKKIKRKTKNSELWCTNDSATFNFERYDYLITQGPMECYVLMRSI